MTTYMDGPRSIPCPDCGRPEGVPGVPHGAPEDTSLAGLLCTVRVVARVLGGDPCYGDVTPGQAGSILDSALARFSFVPDVLPPGFVPSDPL